MGRIDSYEGLGCLVTGASSGIGREISLELARQGARLVLTARREERLAELAALARERGAKEAHVVAQDLAEEEGADRVADAAERLLDHVDVLVDNAGFSVPGSFFRSDEQRTRSMLQVNVVAATRLVRRLLPGMLARNRGGILVVSSVAGFQPAPFQAAYAGSKAYLLGLTESVHMEVKRSKVSVTTLCPGVTDTEFFDAAGYRRLGRYMQHRMSAEKVARAGLRGLRRGRMTVVPGFGNRSLLFAERLVPRRMVARVSYWLMRGRR